MLIEVVMSALLVALIVIATLNGFDVTSRASASERARAQADALAQQAEDKLRSLPLSKLEKLQSQPLEETPTQNGTKYKIISTAVYVSDETATASCSSSVASASYLRTTSTVTWAGMGARKPVVETGIISPPPGSALIVEVTDGSSEGVAGMNVTASGPAPSTTPHTLVTASNGCAILALLPGEYTIDVAQTGYVDQNWYASVKEDPNSIHSVYLTAETAIKEPYRFGKAGTLQVKFTTSGSTYNEGDSFVAFNSGMTSAPPWRQIGTLGTFAKVITTKTSPAVVFPFKAGYYLYAGACEADNPENPSPKAVVVPPGGKAEAEVVQPPVNIRVMSGKSKASPGKPIENAKITLTDLGCPGTEHESLTNAAGGLVRPGIPYGEYSLCVTGGVAGGNNGTTKGLAAKRIYTTTFENDKATGPSELATITNGGTELIGGKPYAVIYMEAGAVEQPAGNPKEGTEC